MLGLYLWRKMTSFHLLNALQLTVGPCESPTPPPPPSYLESYWLGWSYACCFKYASTTCRLVSTYSHNIPEVRASPSTGFQIAQLRLVIVKVMANQMNFLPLNASYSSQNLIFLWILDSQEVSECSNCKYLSDVLVRCVGYECDDVNSVNILSPQVGGWPLCGAPRGRGPYQPTQEVQR